MSFASALPGPEKDSSRSHNQDQEPEKESLDLIVIMECIEEAVSSSVVKSNGNYEGFFNELYPRIPTEIIQLLNSETTEVRTQLLALFRDNIETALQERPLFSDIKLLFGQDSMTRMLTKSTELPDRGTLQDVYELTHRPITPDEILHDLDTEYDPRTMTFYSNGRRINGREDKPKVGTRYNVWEVARNPYQNGQLTKITPVLIRSLRLNSSHDGLVKFEHKKGVIHMRSKNLVFFTRTTN